MTSDRIIRVTIPGYKEHQRDIKKREYLALEVGFFSNRKVRQSKRECLDAVYCYQWLWANVDYETESIEIKESALKAEWMVECACQSNRFDLQKRLHALSNADLISFQYLSNENGNTVESVSNNTSTDSETPSKIIPTDSKPESNESQSDFKTESNETLNDFKSPLEQPETRTALLDININKLEEEQIVDKEEKNNTQQNIGVRELSSEFEILIAEGRKYFQRQLGLDDSWVDNYLRQQTGLMKYRDDMRPEDFISIWFEAVDSGKANAAQAPKWFKTAFENKLFHWKPKARAMHASVPSKPKHQVLLEAESLKYILDHRIFLPDELEFVPGINNEFLNSHFRLKNTGEMLDARFFRINERSIAV